MYVMYVYMYGMNERMHEWMNDMTWHDMTWWMNEWMNEWMHELMNEWMNDWMKVWFYVVLG